MHPILRPMGTRRHLIGVGISLSLASLPVATRGQRAATGQPALRKGYANSDDVRLFLVEAGEGPLILFLHGAPDSWQLYEALLLEFSRDHLAVAPNLRGFPPSDQPDAVEAYAMPRLLGDVHALLRHFGRERCVLVGNDWGGYIAWVFASAYPRNVERLVIFNAPHPAIFLREVRENPAQIEASQYERSNNTAPAPYPPWFNYYRADPIKVPLSVADGARLGRPDLAAHFFTGVADPPVTTSLRVNVPTLVVWGMHDMVSLPGQLDHLEDYVPDMRVVRIDDAGHYPMQSHPALVTRVLRDFILNSN